MGLPEIPVDLWRQFQSTIFGEKADDIQNAESFRWGVDDSVATLPPDDGTDWVAEQRRLEEEQQRRQEEQQRQIEEQARLDQEDYQRILDERAVAQQANEIAAANPLPSSYNDPTAGGTISQPLPPQSAAPASFADTASSLMQQTFGPEPAAPEPTPAPGPPKPLSFADTASDLITSTFGPESTVGKAATGAYETAVRGGMPDVASIVPKGLESARETIDTYGMGAFARDVNEQEDIEREVRASTGKTLVGINGPEERAWAEANPEKAARLEELRKGVQDLAMGASGTMGGGGAARDAIDAIKALRKAGMSEAALNAERELAMKTTMTLDEIQKQTGAVIKSVADAVLPKPPLETAPASTPRARNVPEWMLQDAASDYAQAQRAGLDTDILDGLANGQTAAEIAANLQATGRSKIAVPELVKLIRSTRLHLDIPNPGESGGVAMGAMPKADPAEVQRFEQWRRDYRAQQAPEAEVPNPFPLTAEERALNTAADARAREAPPHAGYLEDPAFGIDEAAGPQPGDRIRLPDGTRARVEAPETDLAPTTYEPPTGPQPGERVRLPDGTRATVTEGGGAPPTGRPPAPPSGGPPLPPVGGRQLPMPGMPERPPEDLTHVRGFGILQGVDEVGREALERAAERGRQFPKGVPRASGEEAAVRLGMTPEEVAAKWHRQDTREAADEIAVLRQGVAASLDDVQEAARKARDGTLSPEEQQAAVDGLVNAAVGGEFLRGGRRAAESAGRALNQFRSAVQVQGARQIYDAMDAAAQAARRTRVVLEGLKNGKTPNESGLRQLEETAARLEGAAGRDLLGEGGEAVRRRARRDAGLPEPSAAPGGAPAAGAPKESSFAERWGQLKRAHTAAEEAGDTARAADISDQISALSSEVRADAIDRARKAVEQTKKPLTMEEAQRIVDERLGQGPVSRIRREEMDQAKGFTAGKLQADLDRDVQKKVLAALKRAEAQQDALLKSIDIQTQRKIEKAMAAEKRADIKQQAKDMAAQAKQWMERARRDPSNQAFRDEFDQKLYEMSHHSNVAEVMAADLRSQFAVHLDEDAFKFMSDVERRNAVWEREAADAERAGIQKESLQGLVGEARQWMDRARRDPSSMAFRDELEGVLAEMTGHSDRGAQLASDIKARRATQLDEDAFRYMSDVEKRLADEERKAVSAERAGIQKEALQAMAQRLRDTVKAIHDNPNHPGLLDEVDRLMADMTSVSTRGFEMSSDIKKSLTKAGLQRFAGKLSEDQVDQLMGLLRNIDPDDPRALGNIMAYMRRGHALDRVREFSVANMLSSTATASPLGINNIGNAGSAAAHYGFKLPGMAATESVRTLGGRRGTQELAWGDVGAAYRAAAGAFGPAIQDAVAIMRHGSTGKQAERASQLADFGGSHPELMGERPGSLLDVAKLKWGPVGELLHMLSTRQLEASDAFWSNILESGNYAALAARKARLSGGKLTAEQVLANPLDHMDVLEQAQRMSRYTLLKQRSAASRVVGSAITAKPDAGVAERWGKFAAQQVIPFTTTPLNSVLQLLEYSPAGAAVQGTRAALTKDGFARAELTNKALAGATLAGIGLAGVQSQVPNAPTPEWTWVTGAAPIDTEKRKALQAQGWQENSVWNPVNRTYNSLMGTPMAPVLFPAWALQGFADAVEKGERKGTQKEWETWLTEALAGSAQRTVGAVIEQSLLRSVGDIVQGFRPEGDIRPLLAGEITRYIPAGGLVAQLARLGDGYQREAKTIVERVGARTPLRGLLPERQGPLGEALAEPMSGGGLAGALTSPWNAATMALGALNPSPRRAVETSNPTYQAFAQAGVDIGAPKTSLSLDPQISLQLTPDEQRRWQTLRGELLQKQVPKFPEKPWWNKPMARAEAMETILADAGKFADARLLKEIGPEEIRRRAREEAAKVRAKARAS